MEVKPKNLLDFTRRAKPRSPFYVLIWAGTYLHWEGQQHNIHFPDSGVTVETHIDADAQSRAFTAYAGYVYRPADGKTFNCYKVCIDFLTLVKTCFDGLDV